MAYLAPIHRPSSIRHALKLNLLDAEEECLVVAKANRIEIWIHAGEGQGLIMAHSKMIYGHITILEKLRPANSETDHLFLGTERFQYFTASWNPETRQLDTIQSFIDVSEKSITESQTLDRCSIDPTGQHVVMELYRGILSYVKVVKPKKNASAYLTAPEQIRITELDVRSSTFLHTETKVPKYAMLYQSRKDEIRLAIYPLTDEKGNILNFDPEKDREDDLDELDPGACWLIPVGKGQEEQKRYIVRNASSLKAELGGVIVVGESSILYLDDESKATVEYAMDEPTIFVAWAQYDHQHFFLGDDYGNLHLLKLLLDGSTVTRIEMEIMATISRPTELVCLENNLLFVASHEGNSQLLHFDIMEGICEVTQTFPNIAPIMDFTVMDMGSRSSDAQTNEYSSGQARIVTGSGAYQSGSLRSVRSGVGLEDVGLLGEMKNVRALFSLKASEPFRFVDTLIISLLTETRILCFDNAGEVEEVEEFHGMIFDESTILAMSLDKGRVLQVTESKVIIVDIDSSMVLSTWQPPAGGIITAASSNDTFVLLSSDGKCLITLDLRENLSEVARQDLGDKDQVACVFVPPAGANIALVGFWQSGMVSILNLSTLDVLHGELVRNPDSAAIPRSLVMAQILPVADFGPTLLVGMSDGIVLTFTVDKSDYSLSGKKSIVLGTQQPNFRVLAGADGLSNIFTTCEHSSLIYSSEGRIVYSAVTAEDATCVCSFDSEAYPDSIILATSEDIRIAQVDAERRTHVRTLEVGEAVRRIAYSASEGVFGMGCIKKVLENGEEIVSSSFRLVDEVVFGKLGKTYELEIDEGTELVESVIRAQLPNSYGELQERFIVGTSFLEEDIDIRGRIIVFGIDHDRSPYEIMSKKLKGACRCLGVLDGKIVAALVKTVVMFEYKEETSTDATLERVASYRTSTMPIDIAIEGNIIAVADLMKSVSLVEWQAGKDGVPGEMVEVSRHYEAHQTTAVCHIEGDTYLEADADGNLLVLRRNVEGITRTERLRLQVTSEMNLGEQVNSIKKITVETSPNAPVIPRAFVATVEGSIYLFATIASSAQDLLMRLQSRMAELVQSPGHIPFNLYRATKTEERQTEEPFRFVDGELLERFLDVSESLQEEICTGLGPGVEDIRNLVEELKRLH